MDRQADRQIRGRHGRYVIWGPTHHCLRQVGCELYLLARQGKIDAGIHGRPRTMLTITQLPQQRNIPCADNTQVEK